MIGIVSLSTVERAIYSALVVDNAIFVCSFDFYIIKHPAYLIIYPVWEYAEARFSAFNL